MQNSNPETEKGTITTVDPVIAGQQTANYRTFMQGTGINEIAFFIKVEDLLGALQLPITLPENYDISGIRVYMALEEMPGPGGNNHSHMYVVGTDAEKNDIVFDENNNSAIYDMTWPCPDLCSQANVLNGFGADVEK